MLTKIAVFVSGGGTNLQALINAQQNGKLKSGTIALVVSTSPKAFALQRANIARIPTQVIPPKDFKSETEYEDKLFKVLDDYGIELIVLAGYMHILGERFVKRYPKAILNVHPSLIPAFCGQGYYGLKVHEAALARGVKVSGATVHFVNEIPDGGEIILQKSVMIRKDETPESLQHRIMENAEWILLPTATEMVAKEMMKNKEPSTENK